jgi:anaphase-promoting complex subunit 2
MLAKRDRSQVTHLNKHVSSRIANMAAVNAKRRVFESVFGSQVRGPVKPSSQAIDQVHWDRSWGIVTQALNLPFISDEIQLKSFISIKSRLTDPILDENVKNLLRPETRLSHVSQTPDIILWYTNHVRRHYLNQVFPIIQKLQKTQSPSQKNIGAWVTSCALYLQGAYSLYFEGLRILIRPLNNPAWVVKNFRLNLSTVVSNSIPDRAAIKWLVRQTVYSILNKTDANADAQMQTDFLALVKSLNDVGLGGEK